MLKNKSLRCYDEETKLIMETILLEKQIFFSAHQLLDEMIVRRMYEEEKEEQD